MKWLPFPVIQAAKEFDPEAVELVLQHFEGYIVSHSSVGHIDTYGNRHFYVDDDLYYQAVITIFKAIANFHFYEPPDNLML